MSENSDVELKKLIKGLAKLDEVPQDIASRMDATVQKLAAAEKSKKSSRFSSSSWALAAGLTLIFGLGAISVLNNSNVSPTNSNVDVPSTTVNKDDILTSNSEEPINVNEGVPLYSTGIDYSNNVTTKILGEKAVVNYGKLSTLPKKLNTCLISLGLENSVSFIDSGFYKGESIIAVWSALSGNSWSVFIIDANCEGIAEEFVNE